MAYHNTANIHFCDAFIYQPHYLVILKNKACHQELTFGDDIS